MAGLVTGVIRMVVEFSYAVPTCGSGKEDKRPDIITKVHYLIFAIILCSVAFVVMVAVSVMTAPRTKKQVGLHAFQLYLLLCFAYSKNIT